MKKIIFISAVLVLLFCIGCEMPSPGESEPPADVFSEVFNDGLVCIEAGQLIRIPGSREDTEYCFLEIRLTNNNISPIYYSSMLCLSAKANGTELSTENVLAAFKAARTSIDGFETPDGVIHPASSAQGFIFFEAPVGTKSFDISLATDYGNDEWVSFSCAVS